MKKKNKKKLKKTHRTKKEKKTWNKKLYRLMTF